MASAAEIQAAVRRGKRDGLILAAQLYINAMRRALRGGYTSGAFVSGATVAHVTRTDPVPRGAEDWQLSVGTNLLYNLYWELGHHNLFTRRFERVELWVPTLRALARQIQATIAARVRYEMRLLA